MNTEQEQWFEEWFEKLVKKSASKQSYMHFDRSFNYVKRKEAIKTFFAGPIDNVSRHSFYPLIKYNKVNKRIKKIKKTDGGIGIEVKEKVRPISYAAHFDSIIYSWYAFCLSKLYTAFIKEQKFFENVIAYLPLGKSNMHFSHDVQAYIKKKGDCIAITYDIEHFFDTLGHQHLSEKWLDILNKPQLPRDHKTLFKHVTEYSYVLKEDIESVFPETFRVDRFRYCTPAQFRKYLRGSKFISDNPDIDKKMGIPQGLPISSVLSNIYMIDFDREISRIANEKDAFYRRYSDDIIIVCDQRNAEAIQQVIENGIRHAKLRINDSKTELRIFRVDEFGEMGCFDAAGNASKLQYLGFEFDGKQSYLRPSTVTRVARKRKIAISSAINKAYGPTGHSTYIYRKSLGRQFHINAPSKGSSGFMKYGKSAIRALNSESIALQLQRVSKKLEKNLKKAIEKKEAKLIRDKVTFNHKI